MVRVKVCGITNVEDALAVFEAGADAIGFVFYRKSKRFITPDKAKEISKVIPPFVARVGVFVDEKEDVVLEIAEEVGLDAVQLHGSEPPETAGKLAEVIPVIKAISVGTVEDVMKFKNYPNTIPLFDTKTPEKGGSGKTFPWEYLSDVKSELDFFILSGGLNETNILKAIEAVNPPMVDVSSGVEKEKGIKDHEKVKRFVKMVKCSF